MAESFREGSGAGPSPARIPKYLVDPGSYVDGGVVRVVGDDDLVWAELWDPASRSWRFAEGESIRAAMMAPPASASIRSRFGIPPSDLPKKERGSSAARRSDGGSAAPPKDSANA
jgi:hypothetical protein